MKKKVKCIEQFVLKKTKMIKKKRTEVENIELSFHRSRKGSILTKLKAKLSHKTINLQKEGYEMENSVSKLFSSLERLLRKSKYQKATKLSYNLRGDL